jgi:hypothetical protein
MAGIIVAVLLVLYQPFGIHELQTDYLLLKIAGFGIPCVIPVLFMGYIRNLLVRYEALDKNWCIGYEMLLWIPMLLLIGIFNLAYLWFVLGFRFPASFAWRMEFHTFLIGMIPCMILLFKEQGFSAHLYQMIQEQTMVKNENAPELTRFELRTEREHIEIYPQTICFIKAEGNYVEVIHCNPDESPKNELIRISLKDTEKQLIDQKLNLPKCHRSYLVNTERIARVEGNAQGLTLHLDRGELTVPVSRSCVNKFKQKKSS